VDRKTFFTGLATAGLIIGVVGAAPVAAQDASPSMGPAVPTTPTGYTELDTALTPKADGTMPYAGTKVDVQVQWTGGELAGFQSTLADFQKATGITVQVDSVPSSHETVLKSRVEGGAPPDIAQLAQPTPILAYAAEGKTIDLASFMDAKKLTDEHPSIALLTQDGKIWGLPYKQDVKSLVWYSPKAFAAAGYKVPTTWDELIALSDQIVKDGSNPWCISAGGPGTATGWEITDWVEEVVLKTMGIQYYNDWINHKVTFEDPGIKAAFDNYVGKIFFTPNYVYGGPQAIVNTDLKTPMDPMFPTDGTDNWTATTAKCWMQKIPTWYGPDFFPDQRVSGQPSIFTIGNNADVALFPFPTIDPKQNNAEVSGDTMTMFVDRPEVRAVMEFMSTPDGLRNWILGSGAISSNSTTPADWYAGNYKLQVAAQVANSASGLGFDASDLMPGAVGAGTFWTESVDWVNNNGSNTDAVLKAIDDSWPAQ
jgi:alpha-glucoside transport system substrate-binding protein